MAGTEPKDAVFDQPIWGGWTICRRAEFHQSSAQLDGRLAEHDRAEHQLKHNPVELIG